MLSDSIDEYIADIGRDIGQVNKELYFSLKSSYNGQRNNRDEFRDLEFDEIIRDWCSGGSVEIQRIMNKDQIARFVDAIEKKTGCSLFQREKHDKEHVSSQLLLECIEAMEDITNVPDSFLELLKEAGFIYRYA